MHSKKQNADKLILFSIKVEHEIYMYNTDTTDSTDTTNIL